MGAGQNYVTAAVRKAYELMIQMDGGHLLEVFQKFDTDKLASQLCQNIGSWLSSDIAHALEEALHRWATTCGLAPDGYRPSWLKGNDLFSWTLATWIDWHALAQHFQMELVDLEEEERRFASCGKCDAYRCSLLEASNADDS